VGRLGGVQGRTEVEGRAGDAEGCCGLEGELAEVEGRRRTRQDVKRCPGIWKEVKRSVII